MEANQFRNEANTMQARIEAMREQNWVDSDEFVKVGVRVAGVERDDDAGVVWCGGWHARTHNTFLPCCNQPKPLILCVCQPQANVTALSPELRDLLDKILVADEFKRITMQVCWHRSVEPVLCAGQHTL
jgi:hypothetical protein